MTRIEQQGRRSTYTTLQTPCVLEYGAIRVTWATTTTLIRLRIARLLKIPVAITVVLDTSEVAGNSVLLNYMPRKRTPGNLRNEVPFFAERICGFVDYISVVLMEIVLLHLNIELKENEKDNFNAIQHLCAVRLSDGTREYAEKTEESHL